MSFSERFLAESRKALVQIDASAIESLLTYWLKLVREADACLFWAWAEVRDMPGTR